MTHQLYYIHTFFLLLIIELTFAIKLVSTADLEFSCFSDVLDALERFVLLQR